VAPRIVEQALDRLGRATALDAVAKPLAKKVEALIPQGAVKDALSGTWLGHPLHPMLTDLPIGCWTNAMALDFLAGRKGRAGAQFLVGLGVVAALPTAASGLSDWSDTLGEDRRLGFAHAAGNTVALACYGLSWLARRRGDHRRGVALGLLGGAVATGSAYIGGHLAWRRGVNVDRHAFNHPSGEWTDVGSEADIAPDGPPVAVAVGDDRVLLVRDGGGGLRALSDVCGHAGGPLHEGEVDDGCVTCPWHGSTFRLDDGSVVHGPATGPQPVYEVRVAEGRVSVRRP
jgi:nitrite reductase/ring-hydroxylating ferredoxin subunit/uncharacterized membrane protein